MTDLTLSPQLLARQVILVDEDDQEVGTTGLVEAHQGEGMLHRASSVFLFRKNGKKIELLLQQRSPEKIVAAREWANTACGNIAPGQSYSECALDRLKLELGIEKVELTQLNSYRYQVRCNDLYSENEITKIFTGWFDGKAAPNPAEVSQIKWVAWQDLLDGKLDNDLSPWTKLIIKDKETRKLIAKFLKGK